MTPANIVGMAAVKELGLIAVTDHSTCKNCGTVLRLAEEYGVLAVPGMELTTREEAHMLCYFRTVEECMAFGERIYAHLPPIPNREEFFGRQQVMNAQDEEIAVEERLLISALDLGFEACERMIHEAGGLCVPAHINRGSNGVLNALGFLPPGATYDALEISRAVAMPLINLSGYRQLESSDAHYLENILEPTFFIEAKDRTIDALFDAIAGNLT